MDDFVRDTLTDWKLSKWIDTFKDHRIDKERFYGLDNQKIEELIPPRRPRSEFKKRLKLLKKEQNTTNPESVDSSARVFPSSSGIMDKGKRRLDLQGEYSQRQPPPRKPRLEPNPEVKKKTEDRTLTEEKQLSEVKDIMGCVYQKIPEQDNKLNNFLRRKIRDLETDKREVVGVFGRTGAGKSCLINTVIGETNLLPTGDISACTSAVIKVEANMENLKYEADIEFITKEEWKDELWYCKNFHLDYVDQESDQSEKDDYDDIVEKLSVLYGEDWKKKSKEDLMDGRYFKKIPEFLNSGMKMLIGETAEELSAKLVIYIKSGPKDGEVKKCYWPLVKCVTIRVPDKDLLKHVTLVDLPGNGDCNKSRNEMWKTVVGRCSTVWIVTDINRAASEKEPWEILTSACSFIGNAGQCRQIHFICTKSEGSKESSSTTDARAFILKTNDRAKKEVNEKFSKLKEVKKHFSDESFKVFTVSSFEFLGKTILDPADTEIPKLQEFLQGLNDCHSVTLNYVSGAHGILSLIQGARLTDGADTKTAVCTDLKQKMRDALDEVEEQMEETLQTFEKCLSEGVEKSKSSCEKNLNSVINPRKKSGSAFHRTLWCIVQHDGIHKPKKEKQINLNMKLSTCLTDSIDEKFKKTFPNEGECEQFNGVLNLFSLDTKMMRKKAEYKDVELQLIFLQTEEDKIKTKLNKFIRDRKKMIYSSLTTTIEKHMQECYDVAKEFRNKGSLKMMREHIENHVRGSKHVMFQSAKEVMLKQLSDLKSEILEDLEKTMKESIELSLETDGVSIPDVVSELEMVKKHHNELKGSPDEGPIICVN